MLAEISDWGPLREGLADPGPWVLNCWGTPAERLSCAGMACVGEAVIRAAPPGVTDPAPASQRSQNHTRLRGGLQRSGGAAVCTTCVTESRRCKYRSLARLQLPLARGPPEAAIANSPL